MRIFHIPRLLVSVSKMSTYSAIECGTTNSTSYRMFINSPSGPVSPFHDIPLYADKSKNIFNMVVEIPRWTQAKMEICKEEPLNPIKQDVKKGKLRFVNNVFPHYGYIWNYGALPQTWEDPGHVDQNTKAKGDNDPIDVCEIGSKVIARGSILLVKVLGILAMIDEGETDWKVMAINVNDPLAEKMNDISDVDKYMPGFLNATRDWFRFYKVPTGKPENEFAFGGEFQGKDFALDIIKQTHTQWESLIMGKTICKGLECSNASVKESPHHKTSDKLKEEMNKCPPFSQGTAANDPALEEWHFSNPYA